MVNGIVILYFNGVSGDVCVCVSVYVEPFMNSKSYIRQIKQLQEQRGEENSSSVDNKRKSDASW